MSRRYKTGTVARQLGISPPLLRMWETRYELVHPTRGPGGQRLYSDEDIAVLRAVTTLVARGHSIGELATWPRAELLDNARDGREPTDVLTETSSPPHPLGIGDTVLASLDQEGVIQTVSPNVEAVLGWAPGILVGQPIWGLLIDLPPTLEQLVTAPASRAETTTLWVWMRSRSGTAVACRLVAGHRRQTSEGTTVTITINVLDGSGQNGLSPLLDHVAQGGFAKLSGTPEQILREYVIAAVEKLGAALARVWTHEPRDGTLRMIAGAGISKAVATSPRSVIQLSSYRFKVGVVARTGVPYLHNDLSSDRDFDPRWIRRERLESAAVIPLMRDRQLFAVAAHFFRRRLDASDVGKLQAAISLCEASLRQPVRRTRAR